MAHRQGRRRSAFAAARLYRYRRSGATADACTIWIVQWVGAEIRVLDYCEAVGQVLASHVNWLRPSRYAQAMPYLPHDGVNEDSIAGKRYEDHLGDAGFAVEPPVSRARSSHEAGS
jgi:phage terminase large subunit